MKFPYANISGTHRPIIPLVLHKGDASVSTNALVDSGADSSIFHADYAAVLGIENVADGTLVKFAGISSAPIRGYLHTVTLEIGGSRFPDLEIAFSPDLSPDSTNILGQRDFFTLFPIKFSYGKKEINLMTSSRDAA